MSDRHEDADARLARLRDATDPVRPRPDFALRVAATIERAGAETSWLADLFFPARRLVPIAAIAAAVGIVWAAQSAPSWRGAGTVASTAELDTEW